MSKEVLFVYKNTFSALSEQLELGKRRLLVAREDLEGLLPRISTDGIFPTRGANAELGQLSSYALAGVPGIKEGDVQKGGFAVLVVGPFFGGGSARQQAVDTLREAGIKTIIVVGGSAERIFKENCFNSGGPEIIESPADPGEINSLLGEIYNGTLVVNEQFPDPVRPLIKAQGGLFEFTKKRLSGELELPVVSHPNLPSDYPMTAAQKMLARNMTNIDPKHHVVLPGDAGFIKTSFRFAYELTSPNIENVLLHKFGIDPKIGINDPGSVALFEDHAVWAGDSKFTKLIERQRLKSSEWGVTLYRQTPGIDGSLGICHTLIKERCLAMPGQYLIGTDSHTDSAGALNAYAEGVGAGTMASSLLTRDNLVIIPESVKVVIKGRLPDDCTAKDAMLFLLAHSYIKNGDGIHKVLEFMGSGITNWSLDELFVLANMSVEAGATTGIVTEITPAVVDHISRVKGLSPRDVTNLFVQGDTGAQYANTIEINLDELEPMIATPGHPTNGIPVSRLPKTPITSAFIGSCTGGNLSDLKAAAAILKNNHVQVPTVIQAASMDIYNQAKKEGLDRVFITAGAQFLTPGCGACIGLGPGRAENPTDVIITDTNRNWPGRTGHEQASVYLSNPAVVAASSIAGYICNHVQLD